MRAAQKRQAVWPDSFSYFRDLQRRFIRERGRSYPDYVRFSNLANSVLPLAESFASCISSSKYLSTKSIFYPHIIPYPSCDSSSLKVSSNLSFSVVPSCSNVSPSNPIPILPIELKLANLLLILPSTSLHSAKA